MKRRRKESGQAMIELAVMLLAIAAMILALLVLADVQFTGNSLVLDARFKAQHLSRTSGAGAQESGFEYGNWESGRVRLYDSSSGTESGDDSVVLFRRKAKSYRLAAVKDDNGRRIASVAVPFAVGAESSRNSGQSAINPAYSGLAGESYSANSGDWENFRTWRTLSNFSGAASDADFSGTINAQNALNAASLIRATGSEEGRLLNSYQASGAHSSGDALWRMKRAFAALFGGDPDKFSPPDDPANQAVMPQIVR